MFGELSILSQSSFQIHPIGAVGKAQVEQDTTFAHEVKYSSSQINLKTTTS